MDIKKLALDNILEVGSLDEEELVKKAGPRSRENDIAIIGMAGKIGEAEDLNEFWQLLLEGRSGVRKFPASRQKDVDEFLRLSGVKTKVSNKDYLHAAFLSSIDKFDHDFFGISKQEAKMMAPEQRLFLSTAWHALEDAGYGGDSIKGSNTGVFAGISNDFGESYRRIVDTVSPDAPEISVVGNINSVIACRLAYLLDLKGPTMLIDTACSSSLVSLHLACQSLRKGECDMALVGTVNINLVPLLLEPTTGVGVKDIQDNFAADNHTKTFDESSDGMSIGEGVLVFALKPLQKAQEDRDQVHAIIRGSSINQDGQSVGLTAPNSDAQSDLIHSAWRDAAVSAKDVSYIEAHGTGTKLGDPVEISGIEKAFKKMTTRKQFCGVGSVKSNIGHLDNAAGLAGLAKVVLSMKHRALPASLNFRIPNRQISFEKSPVYVNDRLQDWFSNNSKNKKSETSKHNNVIAGISSYGLSGTNCHVVLESANEQPSSPSARQLQQSALFPISARTEKELLHTVKAYLEQLTSNNDTKLADLCFTASTGRRHYKYRVAFIVSSVKELIVQLVQFLEKNTLEKAEQLEVYNSRHRTNDTRFEEITKAADQLVEKLSSHSIQDPQSVINLNNLADYYCNGAEINWEKLFEQFEAHRISLPLYPFSEERCWVDTTTAGEMLAARRSGGEALNHPLLAQVIESQDSSLYQVTLSAGSHWELADHKVQGSYVLPGTCYVEMMLAAAERLSGSEESMICFESIQFLNPFIVDGFEVKDLSLQLIQSVDQYEVKISSRTDNANWQTHATAKLAIKQTSEKTESVDLSGLITSLPVPLELTSQDDLERGLEIGDRWYKSLKQSWCNVEQTEFLAELAISSKYVEEINDYYYHPALLDTAINAANHIGGSGDLYLPFFYKGLKVYRDLPGQFFVHLLRENQADAEVVNFQVFIYDEHGNICASVEQYGIKKANQFDSLNNSSDEVGAFCVELVEERTQGDSFNDQLDKPAKNSVLILHTGEQEQLRLIEELQQNGTDVCQVRTDQVTLGESLAELKALHLDFNGIVYTSSWQHLTTECDSKVLHQLMHTIQSLVQLKLSNSGNFIVLTNKSYGNEVDPLQAAIASFTRVAALENPQMSMLCFDVQPEELDSVVHHLQSDKIESTGQAKIVRKGSYFNESLELLNIDETAASLSLKDQGTYFVSGGCGGLGLELGLEMANQAAAQKITVKLILTSTTELPERTEWSALVNSKSTTLKLKTKLTKLIQLLDLGVELDVVVLDVSNAEQLQGLLHELRKDGRQINGVIHAAGRAGDGFIINKSFDELERVLSPKVQGGWNLHHLTKEDPLDFFVMYSSIAGVCHEAGQSDYTAANRFMDALAVTRRNQGLPALSVAWPAWRETGIALEYNAVDEDELFKPINTKQALQALFSAISAGTNIPASIVLSNLNPQATVEDFEALNLFTSESVQKLLRKTVNGNRQTKAGKDLQSNQLKQADLIGISAPDKYDLMVATVWSQVLGKPEFHIDDSFNDLGGNSILTTQKYQAFEGLHPGVIDMADLFTHTTLREQAAVFRKSLEPAGTTAQNINEINDDSLSEQTLEEQLAKLAAGEISVEEVQGII